MSSKFNNHSPGYAEYTRLKRRQAIISNGLSRPEDYRLRQIENKSFGTDSISMVFMQGGLDLGRTLPNPDVLLTVAPSLTYTSGPTVTFPPLPGSTTTYKLFNNAGNALIADLGPNTNLSIASLINPPANLSPNTPYTVYVAGSNSLGLSPPSSTITFTTPPAPPTITSSGTNLTIPSSSGATNYRLISTPAIVPQPTIAPGTTSFSSLGLTPGTTYTLSTATTGANSIESLPGTSVTVYTPPNPIQTVSYGASTSSSALVSWAAPSVGGVTGYNVYDGSTLYATIPGNSLNFGTVAGQPALASGTTFTNFSVKAYYNTPNNESTSIPLTFQTTAVPPLQPTLSLSSKSTSSVSLSWVPGTGAAPTGYILTQDGSPVTLSPVTSTSITINTGINAGTMYTYSLRSYFTTTTNTSTPSSLLVYTTPNPIQSVSYGASTSTTAVVSWAAPSLGGVTGYNVYDASTLYTTITGNTLTFGAVVGQPALASGTTFTNFSVKAYYNTPNNESTSVALTFQTTGSAPSQPTLTLTSKSKNSVSLSWVPGAGLPVPTGYILTQDGTPVIVSPVTSTSITINTGINAGTMYTYALRAYAGATTNVSTPASLVVYTNPNTPVLATSNITSTQATLGLSVLSGGFTGYKIYNGAAIPANLLTTITSSSIVLGAGGLPALTYEVPYKYNVVAYFNTIDNESVARTLDLVLPPPVSLFSFADPGPNTTITGFLNSPFSAPFPIIPSTVTTVAQSAFFRTLATGTIRIPSSVTNIRTGAFAGTFYVTNLILSNGLTTIEANAFEAVGAPIALVIPEGVTSIGQSAFRDSPWTSVTVPSSVTSIGPYAFNGCGGITTVTLPPGLTTLSLGVFRACPALTGITLPTALTSIGREAFEGATALTGNIIIPRTVTSIGDMAFHGCTNPGLRITYYATTTIEAPRYPGYGAFTGLVVAPTVLP